MSKKESKKAELVVAEPAVQNGINMNLTHADVIEVAVQTQLEILEPQLEQLIQKEADLNKSLKTVEDTFINKALEKATSSPVGKEFLNAIGALEKGLGKTVEWAIQNQCCVGKSETLESPEYDEYGHGDPEEYRSPLTYFKRNTRKRTRQWNLSTVISFDLRANVGSITLKTDHREAEVNIPAVEYQKWKKETQAILNEISKVSQEKYNLWKQILELKYDEKKVKARVVKMSLSKTEQGRNILNLLESATNVKLLS